MQHIKNDCEALKLICEKSEKIKNLIIKNKKTYETLKCVYKASMQACDELRLIQKALNQACKTSMI